MQRSLGHGSDDIRQFALQAALLEGIRHLHADTGQQHGEHRIQTAQLDTLHLFVKDKPGWNRTLCLEAFAPQFGVGLAHKKRQGSVEPFWCDIANTKICDAVGTLQRGEIREQ